MARRVQTPDGDFCSICGESVVAGAPQCSFCGESFFGDTPGVRCPACGRVVDEVVTNCPTCGQALPPRETLDAKDVLQELREFREQARQDFEKLETAPAATPVESEDRMLEELESLWKLSEPFQQIVVARRKRLEQMDRLIAAARRRVRDLENATNPAEVRERDELKRQVQDVLLERDEILKIEYGIKEMEKVYRNVITMQQQELQRKEESLKARLDGFRQEAAKREGERQALLTKEKEIERRERELEARRAELEGQQKSDEATSPGPAPAEREGGVTREEWLAAQREIQAELFKLRDSDDDVGLVPSAAAVRDLRLRVSDLEERLERSVEHRNRLERDIADLTGAEEEVRQVIKVLDGLLGKLSNEEIRSFARSEAFRKYERLMKRLGL